jgi:hypothetical protein
MTLRADQVRFGGHQPVKVRAGRMFTPIARHPCGAELFLKPLGIGDPRAFRFTSPVSLTFHLAHIERILVKPGPHVNRQRRRAPRASAHRDVRNAQA